MAADYRHIGALRIDLVGTTADFRRFGPRRCLPLNDLPGENRRTACRIGEVRLAMSGSRETRVAPGSIGVLSRLPAGGSEIRTSVPRSGGERGWPQRLGKTGCASGRG
jgi:hypothetical protein